MEIKNIEDETTLRRIFDFGILIVNYTARNHTIYNWEFWKNQFYRNPQFLLYTEHDTKIAGAVWGWVELNNNVTVGLVAVDEIQRKRGIASRLMNELVRRVKEAGHPIIVLGSVKESEGFYIKCGFSPNLFVQSKKHTLSDLRAVNDKYKEIWAVESDENGWSKLMLKIPAVDYDLRNKYDQLFEDCVPQTVFLMHL